MDGSDSEIKKKSDKFSVLILRRYNVPVELMDERLTTREAKDRLRSKRDKLISGTGDVHQISAQIILESWFSENR
jgi:putative Holliday junction resolvase